MTLTAVLTKGFGELTFARGVRRHNQSLCARAFRYSLGRSDAALSARLAHRRSRPSGQDCPSTTWDHAISATFAARLRSDNICSTCCPDNTGASSLTGRLLTAPFGPRFAPRLWLPQPTTFFWGLKRPPTLCASSRCLDRPLQHLLPRDNFSSSATSVAARAIAGLCKYHNNRQIAGHMMQSAHRWPCIGMSLRSDNSVLAAVGFWPLEGFSPRLRSCHRSYWRWEKTRLLGFGAWTWIMSTCVREFWAGRVLSR